VICQLLGVPYEDREQFREWTELGYSMRMAEKDLVEDAMTSLTAYIEALVTKKLANADQPAEHLLDELVRTTSTCRSASARTSASAPSWPGSNCRSRCSRWYDASRG
jgi:cytochrome P450